MKKVSHGYGVNANQKVGVITNFHNIYSWLYELFISSWRAYVSSI